jgi:hypothetical protein
MVNAHITIPNLPPGYHDAPLEPSLRPEVTTEEGERKNAFLLHWIVREQIRQANGHAKAHARDGVPGFLWSGNPRTLAARLWVGLDGSPLDEEPIGVLYAYLHRTGHMGRNDTGNKSRQWWVADQWSDTGHAPIPDPEPPVALPAPEPAAPEAPQPASYHAVLTGLLSDYEWQKREVARLNILVAAAGDPGEAAEELTACRARVEELLASNTKLRQANRRLEMILREEAPGS